MDTKNTPAEETHTKPAEESIYTKLRKYFESEEDLILNDPDIADIFGCSRKQVLHYRVAHKIPNKEGRLGARVNKLRGRLREAHVHLTNSRYADASTISLLKSQLVAWRFFAITLAVITILRAIAGWLGI